MWKLQLFSFVTAMCFISAMVQYLVAKMTNIRTVVNFRRSPVPSFLRTVLFVTTHMSEQHAACLKACWPLALENSRLLNTSDVFVYLNCEEKKRLEAIALLESTFTSQKLTIYTAQPNIEDRQSGSMAALKDATDNKWFKGYDWIIRLNPDVIVRDDTFLVNVLENDPDATALLINCRGPNATRPKIHTDFFAIKTEVLPPDIFLNPTVRDAEDAFTNDIYDAILMRNTHRFIPGADSTGTACRAGANKDVTEVPIAHNHNNIVSGTCPVPIGNHPGDISFDHLFWMGLPPYAKDAAKSVGFDQQLWDEGKALPEIFGKPWEDVSDDKKAALQTLGYFERSWKSKRRILVTDGQPRGLRPS